METGDNGWNDGVRAFNAGAFYEAHERWEAGWLRLEGPPREALKGLIQIAAAHHKLKEGNRDGALRIFARAIALLEAFGEALPVDHRPVLASAGAWRDYAAGETRTAPPPPRLPSEERDG